MSVSLVDLISTQLNAIESEREFIKKNSGYYVQYCPCGHFREIDYNEIELVSKARIYGRNHHNALTLHSTECPICNKH